MATARAGNVIGGGDFAEHRLIPDIVRAAEAHQALHLRHPNSVRPWQYVLDVLHGYLMLGYALHEKGDDFASAFNFAPNGDAMTTRDVATHFITALGEKIPITLAESSLHEAKMLKLDASKAKKMLGWQPKLSPREAIQVTADWYKEYLVDCDTIGSFTTSQLQLYKDSGRANQ